MEVVGKQMGKSGKIQFVVLRYFKECLLIRVLERISVLNTD